MTTPRTLLRRRLGRAAAGMTTMLPSPPIVPRIAVLLGLLAPGTAAAGQIETGQAAAAPRPAATRRTVPARQPAPPPRPLPGTGAEPGDILELPILGAQRFIVMRLKYPGDEVDPISLPTAQAYADLLEETIALNSYGSASVQIDITPVLIMPQPATYYENGPTLVRIRADAVVLAEEAGFPQDDYDREIIWSRQIWSGASGQGTINRRTTFLSGGSPYVWAHEIGHAFDWSHANFWRVSGNSPIDPDGTEVEYGDRFDIMGDFANFHHFNPWFKFRAGWIPPANVATVSQSGQHTVRALEEPPDETFPAPLPTSLRIRRDPGLDYWVFFRRDEEPIRYGAVITWGRRTNVLSSLLLDMSPHSQKEDWLDAALAPGEIFRDPDAGIEIGVVDVATDEVTVEVVLLGTDPVDTLPVIDVVGPAAGVTIAGEVDYEATAFDPDLGGVNGAGIDRVTLYLHVRDDPLIAALRAGLPPPHPTVAAVFTAPPYILHVDTAGQTPLVPDGGYFLVVTARSDQGGANTVWFPHIIDNTGPSMPAGTPSEPAPLADGRLGLWLASDRRVAPIAFDFELPRAGATRMTLHDVQGRQLRTLLDRVDLPAGPGTVRWDRRDSRGRRVASGVYFVRLEQGDRARVLKATVLR